MTFAKWASRVAKILCVVSALASLGALTIACRNPFNRTAPPSSKVPKTITITPRKNEHFHDESNEAKNRFPLSEEVLNAMINPKGLPDYSGPTGVVSGRVMVTGDTSPMHKYLPMPKGCEDLPTRYGPLVRKGADGALEEAVVSIIGMSDFVRPARVDKIITISHCAVEPRTIDINLGQRLMVTNTDDLPFEPQLRDFEHVHQLALKDQTVPVFVVRPGIQRLTWFAGMMPGTHAPEAIIWAFPNALHQVTGADGRFRITGVPPGKLTLEVSHLYMKHSVREIEVKANEETSVDVTLDFHATPAMTATSASTSASASASNSK